MILVERLAKIAHNNGQPLTGASVLYPPIMAEDARKILALLIAAKNFHSWSDGGDDDSYYSTKDTLLNAIKAMEQES